MKGLGRLSKQMGVSIVQMAVAGRTVGFWSDVCSCGEIAGACNIPKAVRYCQVVCCFRAIDLVVHLMTGRRQGVVIMVNVGFDYRPARAQG